MEERQTAATARHRPNYLIIFAVLTIFTVLEVILATRVGEAARAPFLLGMSAVKALLVILYFMHLRSDNPWYRVIFALPFIFVIAIMMVIRQ
ncbi:MAG TPA: cytochrome C oxidase subunit IV family protein [Anaerolineae bacterium]